MVIQTLHCAEGYKPHRLSCCELSDGEGANCADCVEDKGFKDGSVECAKGVRDVDLSDRKAIRAVAF